MGDGRPVVQLGSLDFFFMLAALFSIFTLFCLPSSILCFNSCLLFPCVSVWETLLHEYHISFSHTECSCCSLSESNEKLETELN